MARQALRAPTEQQPLLGRAVRVTPQENVEPDERHDDRIVRQLAAEHLFQHDPAQVVILSSFQELPESEPRLAVGRSRGEVVLEAVERVSIGFLRPVDEAPQPTEKCGAHRRSQLASE